MCEEIITLHLLISVSYYRHPSYFNFNNAQSDWCIEMVRDWLQCIERMRHPRITLRERKQSHLESMPEFRIYSKTCPFITTIHPLMRVRIGGGVLHWQNIQRVQSWRHMCSGKECSLIPPSSASPGVEMRGLAEQLTNGSGWVCFPEYSMLFLLLTRYLLAALLCWHKQVYCKKTYKSPGLPCSGLGRTGKSIAWHRPASGRKH